MNMVTEDEERRDRVTELPFEIKQQILSCLPTRDAFSTMALSSLWKFTWVSLPSFDFGVHFFRQFSEYFFTLPKNHPRRHHIYYTFHDDNDDNDDDDDWDIENVGYMQLLDQILQTYTEKRNRFEVITKLSLYVPMLNDTRMKAFASNVVFQWLFLAKHSIEELSLRIDDTLDRAIDSYYALQNYPFLESKTLTKLELDGCYFSSKDNVEAQIDLPSLKHLCLISFDVDQKMLDILLSKCGALEMLELSWGKGFKVLSVPRLSKLKEFRVKGIHGLERVEINTMALQCLTIVELKKLSCKIKLASNTLINLVELFINGYYMTDDFLNNVSEFSHLKTLSLIDCPRLKHIKIISNSLTEFRISACLNLGLVELDAPKLSDFRYSSSNNMITLLSKCPITRVFLCLKPLQSVAHDDIVWYYSKLVELLANFSQSKLCGIYYHFQTDCCDHPTRTARKVLSSTFWGGRFIHNSSNTFVKSCCSRIFGLLALAFSSPQNDHYIL